MDPPVAEIIYDRVHTCKCGTVSRRIYDEIDGELWRVISRTEVMIILRGLSDDHRDMMCNRASSVSGVAGEIGRRLYFYRMGYRRSVFPEMLDIRSDVPIRVREVIAPGAHPTITAGVYERDEVVGMYTDSLGGGYPIGEVEEGLRAGIFEAAP